MLSQVVTETDRVIGVLVNGRERKVVYDEEAKSFRLLCKRFKRGRPPL